MIDISLRVTPQREGLQKAYHPAATTAVDFLPAGRSLAALKRAAAVCEGCALYRRATQTVFGEGRGSASLMLIGEQPGDAEDLAGRPFVGPAGRLLDELLAAAGIRRQDVYVTNAVKHFKWTERGKRRLHAKPSSREIAACRPWLDAELKQVGPQLIVCLGATAAQQLLGASFRVTRDRGKLHRTATTHRYWQRIIPPPFCEPPPTAEELRKTALGELKLAARFLKQRDAADD